MSWGCLGLLRARKEERKKLTAASRQCLHTQGFDTSNAAFLLCRSGRVRNTSTWRGCLGVCLGVLAGASDPAALRAVRAVLRDFKASFIYYTHFEAHSDTSLRYL